MSFSFSKFFHFLRLFLFFLIISFPVGVPDVAVAPAVDSDLDSNVGFLSDDEVMAILEAEAVAGLENLLGESFFLFNRRFLI